MNETRRSPLHLRTLAAAAAGGGSGAVLQVASAASEMDNSPDVEPRMPAVRFLPDHDDEHSETTSSLSDLLPHLLTPDLNVPIRH